MVLTRFGPFFSAVSLNWKIIFGMCRMTGAFANWRPLLCWARGWERWKSNSLGSPKVPFGFFFELIMCGLRVDFWAAIHLEQDKFVCPPRMACRAVFCVGLGTLDFFFWDNLWPGDDVHTEFLELTHIICARITVTMWPSTAPTGTAVMGRPSGTHREGTEVRREGVCLCVCVLTLLLVG